MAVFACATRTCWRYSRSPCPAPRYGCMIKRPSGQAAKQPGGQAAKQPSGQAASRGYVGPEARARDLREVMHCNRFELDVQITRHARERMAERRIDESELLALLENGVTRYKDEVRLWIAPRSFRVERTIWSVQP
ncbi:MAG: DUF4258 domain-containing protein [Pseudomonadota bacterium]